MNKSNIYYEFEVTVRNNNRHRTCCQHESGGVSPKTPIREHFGADLTNYFFSFRVISILMYYLRCRAVAELPLAGEPNESPQLPEIRHRHRTRGRSFKSSANAAIPEHNWEKYDWGPGPAVPDRLYQGRFPQYGPSAVVPDSDVSMITSPSPKSSPITAWDSSRISPTTPVRS